MSLWRYQDLKCPNCGQKKQVMVWSTINARVNPEAREDLLHGRINVLTCDGCGETVRILKTLLYHDMNNKYMVYYFPFEYINEPEYLDEFDATGNLFREADEINKLIEDGYSPIHYVLDINEMVRYIRFREALAQRKQHNAQE